jgi:hypothetical protein
MPEKDLKIFYPEHLGGKSFFGSRLLYDRNYGVDIFHLKHWKYFC